MGNDNTEDTGRALGAFRPAWTGSALDFLNEQEARLTRSGWRTLRTHPRELRATRELDTGEDDDGVLQWLTVTASEADDSARAVFHTGKDWRFETVRALVRGVRAYGVPYPVRVEFGPYVDAAFGPAADLLDIADAWSLAHSPAVIAADGTRPVTWDTVEVTA